MTGDSDGVLDYGANYYRSHCGPIPYDRSSPHWSAFFGGIADTLIRSFQPKKVFDVGCALGFLVEAFWDRGVEAWGRDISEFAISQVRVDMRAFCTVESAAAPISGRYDLVTCIEVLEHMPEDEAIQAIKAMAQATDRILFSSSPDDFEEPTHINVKPTLYWLSLFGAEGFSPSMSYDPTFVTPHCVVFERLPEAPSQATLLGYAEIVRLRLQKASRDQTLRDLYGSLERTHKTLADITQDRAQIAASLEAAKTEASTLKIAENQHRAKLEAELQRQQAELEAHRRLLSEAGQHHDNIVEELAGTYQHIEAVEAEMSATHTELDRLVSSTAWRATGPVRQVGRMLPPSVRTAARRIAIGLWWSLTLQLASRLRQRRQAVVLSEVEPAEDTAPALLQHDEPLPSEPRSDDRLSPEENQADQLPWVRILRIDVRPDLAGRPRLNVLVPGLAMKNMSGGPNTAINLACRLAGTGVAVRLVATSAPLDDDAAAFWAHAAGLSGVDPVALGIELVDASAGDALEIGENDLFMATAWWTAQAANYAVRHTKQKRFVYLIQDYEPLLHPASTQQALAAETYTFDHIPVINTVLLREFFIENKIGRFADSEFAAKALSFEPAIDTTLFHSTPHRVPGQRKRLLFYARPQNGLRNLFELGVAALRLLIAQRHIDCDGWQFCGMGETFAPIDLGSGCTLEPLPWKDLATYAEQMRDSDVLLSLMLSPHPSYPPLEMAACGKPVVTTTFSNKTAARLRAVSPNIIGVEPTLDGVVSGLRDAMLREPGEGGIAFPGTWSASLDGVVQTLRDRLIGLGNPPAHVSMFDGSADSTVFPGFDYWPIDAYGIYRREMVADRAADYQDADASLVSFITPVWNTAPKFLFELAETVFGQDCGPGFEWVIVDNGSSDDASRAALATIAERPNVKLVRVEENIGIVPALRMALELAHNRYVFPLDSDDLLTPDCLRIMTSALRAANLPKLAYSDEDMVLDGHPRNPYSKPDWDPVLFTHSCYIAHLCAIDRETAVSLGCYTDAGAQGSSDWDSFTRFMVAGHQPLHVPEIVYTWRMHGLSTSMNIGSKDYIHDSQRTVLNRFLASRAPSGRYNLDLSPIFKGTPDWRFSRAAGTPSPITTLHYGPGTAAASPHSAGAEVQVERLEVLTLPSLLLRAQEAVAAGRPLHLLSTDVSIEDQAWLEEALTLFELFADTVMVGGRVHRDGIIVAADNYFGFDGPCGSPNIGRSIADPGYFAHLFKPHSCDAVPLQHCVVNASFLADCLPELIAIDAEIDDLPMWLGAMAKRTGRRCVYSPFFLARTQTQLPRSSAAGLAAVALRYADLIPDRTLLSPRSSLALATNYQPVLRPVRAAQDRSLRQRPDLPYPDLHKAEMQARHVSGPMTESADVSVLTALYHRTEADLFRETAATLLAQTMPFREWVILAQGPITPDLDRVLWDLAADPRVKLLRRDTNLGIIDGLRLCLEAATQRFVIPLDADDLLTRDALSLIIKPLQGQDPAVLSYSDEDIVQSGELQSPIRRTDFDAILNDADSTIWHLCAFDRQAALRVGVYTDPGAEFCQDWDTVHRFADAGEPIAHVPHVLYHWRHHAASASGSGSLNTGSVRSVRNVLSRIQERLPTPGLYEIQAYPLFRGAEQLALMRRRLDPLPICLIYVSRVADAVPDTIVNVLPVAEAKLIKVGGKSLSAELTDLCEATPCSHAVLLQEGLIPCNEDGPWDAMRLFEMHKDVVACAGRMLDRDDRVTAACETAASLEGIWVGKTRMDPGQSAMALKPQMATRLADGYFYCSVDTLSEALRAASIADMSDIARALETVSSKTGRRLGYSPLIEARTAAPLEARTH